MAKTATGGGGGGKAVGGGKKNTMKGDKYGKQTTGMKRLNNC